jgi:multiple sugar transport system substrate-binding protein
MRSHRPLSILVILVALLALTVACQRGEQPTEVRFMVFGDPAERDAYFALVEAFETDHPEIDVVITHIPSPREYRTRLATEFAAGNPPDITLMNFRRYASFAAAGQLEPLGQYLDDSDLISADMFFPITIDAFNWQGEIMCIPQNISSLVVYYNADLFAAAGVPEPADDWTWGEFLATAIALTADLDGDGQTDQYGLGAEPSLFRLAPFVWQNGGVIVDDMRNPRRLTLTRFPSQQALDWFVALHTVHGVAPDRVSEASLDSESRFLAGTLAMYLNSRRGTPSYREIETFRWDVAPLPRGREAAGPLHSDAYCLSATAQDKDTAWTFIEFANSPTGQTIIAGTGRTVPSLVSVANSPAFLDPDRLPARSQVWLDQVAALRLVPVISTWEEIEGIASEEIERAFYGDISAAEAAQLADQRTEEYFLLGVSAGR